MDMFLSACCLIYYAVSAVQEIPAIYRIIKRKSSGDYSTVEAGLNFVAMTAWSLYIYFSDQTALVYIGTTSDLVIVVIYTIAVLKYHNG